MGGLGGAAASEVLNERSRAITPLCVCVCVTVGLLSWCVSAAKDITFIPRTKYKRHHQVSEEADGGDKSSLF